MPAWKLIMFQSFLLRNRCPELMCSPDLKSGDIENETADFDASVMQSSSSLKEGAEPGFNKKIRENRAFSFRQLLSEDFSLTGNCFPADAIRKSFFRNLSEESYLSDII